MRTWRAVTLVAFFAVAMMTGCGADRPAGPEEPGGETTDGAGSGTIAAPGIYELDDGRVQAVGTLLRLELEGGFWAVTDVPPGAEPSPEDTADIVAVIPNAEDVRPDIEGLVGEYVAVTGTRLEGPSIRMAGPEIEAETIEVVGADVRVAPEDGGGPGEPTSSP
ncbi:MAG: hypothetical protein IBX62_01550 [Coriobacteriia bacterium]|nr:hypothetical protein [Coriobacteriia bacterium]